MKIDFIGATRSVTGSMIKCETSASRFLVDAGLYQGLDTPDIDDQEKYFDPKEIDFILLTHAHLDHCGYIPRLVRMGFRGKIYCSLETKKIARIIMEDNARIELKRVKKLNKKITKTKLKHDPFYSLEDVAHAFSMFESINYLENKTINDIEIKLFRSGHILGATSIRVKANNKNYLFSGDIGKMDDFIHRKKDKIEEKVNTLIIESTYGDRLHSQNDIKAQLQTILRQSIDQKSRLIIPAFSFGRSQIILTLLIEIFNEDKSLQIPLYLDSPMSAQILKVYEETTSELTIDKEYFNKINQYTRILEFTKERESIIQKEAPYIVLTSSGMMSGGPILYYLEKFAAQKDTIILITGYQARGTHGHDLTHDQLNLYLNEKETKVEAQIKKLDGLSSHADQKELIEYVKNSKSSLVYLVHGEKEAKMQLQAHLVEVGIDAKIPEM